MLGLQTRFCLSRMSELLKTEDMCYFFSFSTALTITAPYQIKDPYFLSQQFLLNPVHLAIVIEILPQALRTFATVGLQIKTLWCLAALEVWAQEPPLGQDA